MLILSERFNKFSEENSANFEGFDPKVVRFKVKIPNLEQTRVVFSKDFATSSFESIKIPLKPNPISFESDLLNNCVDDKHVRKFFMPLRFI